MIHMACLRDGEDMASVNMAGVNMAGARYGGSQIWREPDMVGAYAKALNRDARQVYVLRK